MRILFVDDENSVLEGIENRLRRYRKKWTMDFSNSGAGALELMRKQSFDAVISDMRMPGMDGAELLSRVRDRYSDTLRIVLTGQTAKEQILRSVTVAHRVLNKPCDAGLLESAISSAYQMQGLVNNRKVRSLIENIEGLPSLPSLHLQVTQCVKMGAVDMDVVSDLIEQDPVVGSRILQLVNSSFYGLAREIVSIREAVSYLGLDSVRSLILNIELVSKLENMRLAKGFSIEALYAHSLLSARIAKDIAGGKGEFSELVYSGALLHGIGQLVLAYVLPDKYSEVLRIARLQELPLAQVEYSVLGYTHADVGAYLLNLWDLPFSIIQIVAEYIAPSKTAEPDLGAAGIVHIASEIAHLVGGSKFTMDLDHEYVDRLNLSAQIKHWAINCESEMAI